MLCALDDFLFETNSTDLTNIKRHFSYGFKKAELINAHDDWQATGKYSQSIVLAGKLIKKSNQALDNLEAIAARKNPVTLAFDDGRALTVLINDINTDQSSFLSNGAFLKQEFEVSLEVVYGD